jgi:hypothetical protein
VLLVRSAQIYIALKMDVKLHVDAKRRVKGQRPASRMSNCVSLACRQRKCSRTDGDETRFRLYRLRESHHALYNNYNLLINHNQSQNSGYLDVLSMLSLLYLTLGGDSKPMYMSTNLHVNSAIMFSIRLHVHTTGP